jgi:adenylate cyclase
MKTLHLFLLTWLAIALVHAQQSPTDSLVERIKNTPEDTTRVNLINKLSKALQSNSPEMSLKYAQESYELADKLEFVPGQALALKNIGMYYFRKSRFLEASDYWQKSYNAYAAIKDENGMSNMLNNLGSANYNTANYPRALEYYLKALDLAEKTGDKLRIATTLNNVGLCYMNKPATYEQAFTYFRRSLKVSTEIKDKGNIGSSYTNMGEIYLNKHEDSLALVNFKLGREAYEPDLDNLPYALNSIGKIFQKRQAWDSALFYHNEALQKAKAIGDRLFTAQSCLELAEVYRNINKHELSLTYYQQARQLSDSIKAGLELKRSYDGLAGTYGQMKDYRDAYFNQLKAMLLSDSLYKYNTDSIRLNYEVGLKKKEVDLANAEIKRQKLTKNGLIAGLFLIVLIAGILFRDYRNKIRTNKLLDSQKAEIESLLLNILPAEVAQELQKTGSATPRFYESVSVLFTDFKSFTVIADRLSPQEVVAELNDCFRAFDGIIEKYGLEKIKTIGDSYMCAGGIPVATEGHPERMIRAAMEIRDFVHRMNVERTAKGMENWEMRIGIHVGPLVAGVVGKKKFAYDIWGSTVNVASRMESNGVPDQINISAATYEIVKDHFDCTYRGKIYAKNVGEIDMYFVNGEVGAA